jgi:F5/8 type C domain
MKHWYLVQGLISIAAVSACTDVDSASTPAAPPIARFVASPQSTSELGVSSWEVRNDGTNDHVIGLDASSERQIEFVVRRDAVTPDDRVRLESDEGAFDLTKAGAIENATSDAARRFGADVHVDLGPGATAIESGLGSTSSALSITDPRINDQGTFPVGWNLFDHSVLTTLGGVCHSNTTRHHGEIYSDNGNSGTWFGWADVPNPTDCASLFFMQVHGGQWDNFHWKVFNQPTNLAAGKSASQSSTLNGAGAFRANDGNTDGQFSDNSVSHTNFEASPWWQVDLGTVQSIGGVVVFNRTDCCTDRLSDFDIFISTDGANWQQAAGVTGPVLTRSEYIMRVSARFVRVQLRGSNYLSLAEVQVFAP